VRGFVRLPGTQSAAIAADLRVADIRVNRKCRRLHFLHATAARVEDGTDVMSYAIHYADQQIDWITLVYGHHVRSLWTELHEPLAADKASPVWIGYNPVIRTQSPGLLRLFESGWENPRPEIEIVAIDFISRRADARPFLVALTAE